MKYIQASIHKITPPVLPKVVPRKRLFSLLDQKEHYQVTWISGMAGSGKTTLVASYLDARNIPCLWYQMDEGDGDIATFFYYLGRYRYLFLLFRACRKEGIPQKAKAPAPPHAGIFHGSLRICAAVF